MVFAAHFSTPSQTELIGKMTENEIPTSQTELIGKMTENANNKIPIYAIEYKREYLFIRGLNKEFMYLINKLDNLNDGLFESNTVNRIKYIMKRFLRGQEKGKLKDISDLFLPIYDYSYIQEFFIDVNYEYEFGDNIIDSEFFELVGKIYNKIKIELFMVLQINMLLKEYLVLSY